MLGIFLEKNAFCLLKMFSKLTAVGKFLPSFSSFGEKTMNIPTSSRMIIV